MGAPCSWSEIGSHCRLSQSQERAYALGTIAGEAGVGEVFFADRLSQLQKNLKRAKKFLKMEKQPRT